MNPSSFYLADIVAEGQYTEDITKYDELMAAYKYEVKMWEEAAVSYLRRWDRAKRNWIKPNESPPS